MDIEILRRTAEKPWPLEDGRGNHRVVVNVEQGAPYVKAKMKWRRRDLCTENTGLVVRYLADDTVIANAKATAMTREYGEVVFEATRAGEYAIYYMPYIQKSKNLWFPIIDYSKSSITPCDSAWEAGIPAKMPAAEIKAIESRTDFDSFYPMEIPATEKETQALLNNNKDKPFLVFPEERRYPIKMMYEIPYRWVESGLQKEFYAVVQPDEYFVFQLGVWALEDLDDVSVECTNCRGDFSVSTEAFTCFNTHGTDWMGRPFSKTVQVPAGKIQPMWVGISIPKDIRGSLSFDAVIHTDKGRESIHVSLKVEGENIPDRGDGDLWRLSRLRWINSTIGLDDKTTEPYPPLAFHEETQSVDCLGRRVKWCENGMPERISSFFDQSIRINDQETAILRRPAEFILESDGKPIDFAVISKTGNLVDSGCYSLSAITCGDEIEIKNETKFEYDGHIETFLTVTSDRDRELDNVTLNLTMTPECSKYMMGMGREGGISPKEWDYKWNISRTNNFIWLGGVNGGLHIKLKHTQEVWELYTYEHTGLPEGWYNNGNGGCHITWDTEGASIRAYSGRLSLKASQPIVFRYSLMITPLKELDSDAHWRERYDHPGDKGINLEESKAGGATVVNLHQGQELNPYINYPFHKDNELKAEIRRAHDMGIMYKLYYTVRELTTHTQEFWALRSLGSEVLLDGPSFRVAEHFIEEFFNQDTSNPSTGGPWVCEHLVEGYIPAWQTIFADGSYDCSVATAGLSRWHNYYLEGLSWLTRKLDADGIYLDGVGYDRQIMKRVRKVLNQSKKGSLIDFHSGNNFHPQYGLCNVMGGYMELMPSMDSLWLGEAFDYEGNPPDYWLVEISGIPFGLMGDMLHRGGNKWRGMVFGMTPRCNWPEGGSPLPVWKLWESFGMQGCVVKGWWDESCPVRTSRSDVKATAYVQPDRMLIAVASWAGEQVRVRLELDATLLHMEPDSIKYELPEIDEFQAAEEYTPDTGLTLEPGKGKIILVYFYKGKR